MHSLRVRLGNDVEHLIMFPHIMHHSTSGCFHRCWPGHPAAICVLVCLPVAHQVVGDATLELTLSQFWSNLGSSSIEVEVSFFGLTAEPVAAVAGGGSGGSMVLDAAAGPLKVGQRVGGSVSRLQSTT